MTALRPVLFSKNWKIITFDEDITQLVGQTADNEKDRRTQERKCEKLTNQLETISDESERLMDLFASAPVETY